MPKQLRKAQNIRAKTAMLFVFAFALVGANQAMAANASVSTLASASISADTAGASFTTLTGPALDEGTSGNVNTIGTITLAPPSGFTFDPSATATATVSRLGTGTAALLTLSPTVTVTANTITITVTSKDAATARSRITWAGIKVRPTAGTPLANGNITMLSSSTAAITGITKGTTSFGTLTEVTGKATTIQFVQAPPASVTAGATLSPAVTVKTTDQFANPVSGLSVAMSLNGGGALTGGGAQSTASGTGIATFSGLSVNQTGSKTLTANVSSPALSVTSSPLSVTPGAIQHYLVSTTTTQTRGTPFSVMVSAQDVNNNTVTTDSSTVVTLTSSTRNALFDGTGDGSFRNNTGTLTNGAFTVSTKDNLGESVTITATDANAKTGASSSITVNGLTGDFRSNVSSGNWDAVGTWQIWNGSSWVAAASVPTGAASVNVAILSGNTITLMGATSLVGTLTVSGTLSFSGSGVLTVGPSGILQSAGTVNGSSTTLIINSGGTYQHNQNGGTIPTATWNSASTCQIIGTTTTVPGGLGQSFGNITWNCPSQNGNINLGGSPTTITGNLSVTKTGNGQLQLMASTGSATTTVSGNYLQIGGTFVINAGGTGTATLTVNGFSLAGGTFDMTSSGTSILNVGGDFSVTGAGLFTRSGTSTASVNFNGSNPQNFTNSGLMQGTISYTVNSGATLLMGANTLSGSGAFTLASGGTLASGHANGLNGNLTVSGTTTLSTGANYIYNGPAAQAAGALLPATVNSLAISNTAGAVTLGQATTATTSVTLASGAKLSLPSGTSGAATLAIASVNKAAGTWGNTGSGANNIDGNHFAGTGVLNVSSGPTSNTALASSGSSSTYGSPVTLTATVTGSGPTPSGTVTFTDGATTLGTGTLDGSGVAAFVISILSVVGSPHTITAVYSGDANYSGSTSSGSVSVTVGQRPITVTADAKNKVSGNPDPPLTSQITSGSLVGSDSLSGALTRLPGESVGVYAIGRGSLTAGANYNLTFVSANLTITARTSQSPMVDLNGNGMSDIWEQTYNATNLAPNASASGDGVSNLQKSIAGVDPFATNSFPAISSFTLSNTTVWASIPSVLGKQYQLQSVTNIVPGFGATNWTAESTVIARTGSVATLSAPVTLTPKFFRVQISDVDTDRDGVNDWEEYQLGLDPLNPYSNGQLKGQGQPPERL
jgi:hypothetical protein